MQRITKISEEKPSRVSQRGYKVAARSCIACHRRKVRCDRGVPCTNCTRCEFTCVYPKETPERRTASLQNVSDRLERVESMLARFCEAQFSGSSLPSAIDDECNEKPEDAKNRERDTQRDLGMKLNQVQSSQSNNMSWEVLLNDGHVVQYVNNANIKDLLQDEDKMRATPSPSNYNSPNLQRNLNHIPTPLPTTPAHQLQNQTQRQPQETPILTSYPAPELALHLWSTYTKAVDPVLKILHIPTTQSAVLATILDPASATRSMLALTYAIYYAAITALYHTTPSSSSSPSEIRVPSAETKEDQTTLLKTYKFALDSILLSTDLMNTPDLTSLQALAIYATTLRTHSPTRIVWVLTGLSIRLSQSLGLHRSTTLHLPPFETELRLRLWWHLCVLDSRAPEDQGFEISVDVCRETLRLPLNVNDDEIWPGMRDFPPERVGWSEMAFFLVQVESCLLLRPVLGPGPGAGICGIAEKRGLIGRRKGEVFRKYGIRDPAQGSACENRDGDDDEEGILCRLARQHFTTVELKMGFILRVREEVSISISRMQSNVASEIESESESKSRPHSFTLACDAIGSNRRLLRSDFSRGFRWLFTTYTQWYALAYVLRCLCNVPAGVDAADIDRAWVLVDDVFPDMSMSMSSGVGVGGGSDVEQQGSIWKCLLRLRQQALLLRPGGALDDAGGTRNSSVKAKVHANMDAGSMEVDFGEFDSMPNIGDGDFNAFSGFATDIPFLPEWNAIIHGCFDEMGESV